MPKQSAFDALSAFWQSESAVPVSPAHELAGAAAEAAGAELVVADELVPAPICDCANKGAAKINDVAHAIALSLQGFINPPFVKRTRCDAGPTPIDIGGCKAAIGRARPHAEQPDGYRSLANVAVRHRIRIGIDSTARCAVAMRN